MFARVLVSALALTPLLALASNDVDCPTGNKRGYYKTGNTCHYCPPGTYNSRECFAQLCAARINFISSSYQKTLSQAPALPPRRDTTRVAHRLSTGYRVMAPLRRLTVAQVRHLPFHPGFLLMHLDSIGYYQGSTGQSSCTICPKGSFCPGNNSQQPQLCSPGHYTDVEGYGQSNCKECPKGTFVNAYGAHECCECCAVSVVSFLSPPFR